MLEVGKKYTSAEIAREVFNISAKSFSNNRNEDSLLLKSNNPMKGLLEEFQKFKYNKKLENQFMKW